MNQPAAAPDEITAYHEAGHAVMALALGRPVTLVSIRPGHAHLGICEFGKPVFRPSEDWLEREMLIALAGMAAESRFTGVHDKGAGARDLRYAEGLAVERAGGNAKRAQRLLRRLFAKAEYLLLQEEHWRAVERIAVELLRRTEISGRAARHIFAECARDER
jgi:hypothetical protein